MAKPKSHKQTNKAAKTRKAVKPVEAAEAQPPAPEPEQSQAPVAADAPPEAAISPTPEAGVQHSYLVTVTNSANGAAVAGATVVLHNYTTLNPQTIVSTTKTTDAQGHATFTTTLHFKKQRIVHGANDFEIILISPTLTVSQSGFSPVEIVLLEDLN